MIVLQVDYARTEVDFKCAEADYLCPGAGL